MGQIRRRVQWQFKGTIMDFSHWFCRCVATSVVLVKPKNVSIPGRYSLISSRKQWNLCRTISWVYCFTLCEIIHYDNMIWTPKNRPSHLVRWQNNFCFLWEGWSRSFPLCGCCLNSGVWWWTQLSVDTNLPKNSCGSPSNISVAWNREPITFWFNWKQLGPTSQRPQEIPVRSQ